MTDWTIPGSPTSRRGGDKALTVEAEPSADAVTDSEAIEAPTTPESEGEMLFIEAPAHIDQSPPWSYPGKTVPYRGLPRGSAAEKPAVLPVKSGPITAPSVPSLGLAGRHRSPVAVVFLSVLTLGIYAMFWYERTNAEMGDFDTRMHVHPAKSTIPVVIAWLIGVLVTVAGALRIIFAVLDIQLPFDPGFTVTQAYLLLGGIVVIPYIMVVMPFSLVAITMTLERVRVLEDRVGRTTDVQLRPSLAVGWLIIPVIGGLILIATVQRRINRVWELAHTPILTGRLSRAS